MCGKLLSVISLLSLMALVNSKPIMVTFGTNPNPIPTRHAKSVAAQERSYSVNTNPAPVSEEQEDTPDPNQYKPLVPHQYRTKLFAVKPPANLILGTPIDVKFTPALQKFALEKKNVKSTGVDYTGPHIFEVQEYEIERAKKALKPSVRYTTPVLVPQHIPKKAAGYQYYHGKYVPQIGIIYSSGLRYYIPQIVTYMREPERNAIDENSVYGDEDEKFHH